MRQRWRGNGGWGVLRCHIGNDIILMKFQHARLWPRCRESGPQFYDVVVSPPPHGGCPWVLGQFMQLE